MAKQKTSANWRMFDGFADHRFYNQNTFNFWAHLAISAEIAHFGKDRNWHGTPPDPRLRHYILYYDN